MTMFDITNIIGRGESDLCEFKSSFDKEAIETLVAFANTKGGLLLVGVDDSGKIIGVTIGKETLQNWLNQIKMATTPSIIPDIEPVEIDGKIIAAFSISSFPVKPIACKGKYFKRLHASNHLMSLTEVANEYLKTFQLSWDAYPHPEAQLADLDTVKIERFIAKVNNVERFRLDESPLHALAKLRLIKESVPTHAAMLLFAAKPLPYNIHIGRFADSVTILDDMQITETLPEAFSSAMQAIAKHINISLKIDGMEREEIWEYPRVVIREALANALVHRDYQNPSDIQVKIFDDKLTIYSPGCLYGNLTIDALRQDTYQSELRNKLVAEVFYLTGIIEKYGSGLTRIRKSVAESGTIQFEMEELSNGFLVTFSKMRANKEIETGGINGGINGVLRYITVHPGSKGTELAAALYIPQRTMDRLIKQLKHDNKIVFKGARKTGGYYVVEPSGRGSQ